MTYNGLLHSTSERAARYLAEIAERRVFPDGETIDRLQELNEPLPEAPMDAAGVIDLLDDIGSPATVATAGPRYFGFVIGGSLPAALAADWLASTWDQDAGMFVAGPAVAVAEEVAARWLLDLLGLPAEASVGLVTGGQMANFTGLAAGRHAVLQRAGWDVEEDGLAKAPPVTVVIGEEAHVTILSSLRMLGLGSRRAVRVPSDGQGRMRADELGRTLAGITGPTIVCAQAGNVGTGAFDPFDAIADLTRERGAWLHVDGAFGLWAAVSGRLRHHLRGVERADSWAVDGHKWLNVPYDCGMAVIREGGVHRAALLKRAAYLLAAADAERDCMDFTPESSRRARGLSVYAALRSLGRRGVRELVERCCALASRMAECLRQAPGVHVLNEVVLNQVLVRFDSPRGGDGDAWTRDVIARVQREGTCWMGGTRWHGQEAMRISVSNWSTSEADIDRSAEVILSAARAEGAVTKARA